MESLNEYKNVKELQSMHYSYRFFEENRYIISDFEYRQVNYCAMCNNGYTKLHTTNGRIYWLLQNETDHLTPDWKFHISVVRDDLELAWDLVSEIFVKFQCKSGMKVVYKKENISTVKGREITIYIFKWDKIYKHSEINKEYTVSIADEHSEKFWLLMIEEIEKSLEKNKIRSNGCAIGDLKIGTYTSLRNEAYVYDKFTQLNIYPPDSFGYNAANQELPINLSKFKTKFKTKT